MEIQSSLIKSKIQSYRDSVGGVYSKPDKNKLDEFKKQLKLTPHALDYLNIKRGLSESTIDNFELGYDQSKDAIAIPVFKKGELINIRYRYIDENKTPKYTQEKGCEVWIYNEDGISKGQEKGGILITEGEFDCMSAWQAGFKNVISPASGKDSYGVWIELLDTIPKVYIAYDNDKPGKGASLQMAERIGTDKSFEVVYPDGVKDANDFFKVKDSNDFKDLIKAARPFYKYKFSGVADVIESLRFKKEQLIKLRCVPNIEFEEDWLVILSGVSNIGKTSVGMNIAEELAELGYPTLIMPFERGIKTVGKRFLQVRHNKKSSEFDSLSDSEWDSIARDSVELPIYFSTPGRDEIKDVVAKSKRLFGVKAVVVDHLDYLVRKGSDNHNVATSDTLQEFKSLAQEHNMIFIVIHHIKKQDGMGTAPKKPRMEDLKGSSSVYQDPEAVIMLSSPDTDRIEIDIVKNKGPMGSKIYEFNVATGKIGRDVSETFVIDKYAKGLEGF